MLARLTLVVLIAVAGIWLSLWLDNVISTSLNAKPVSHSSSLPDYYMKNFVVQGTNVDGKPRFQLAAELMNHYPHDDHSDLIKPKLKFYAKQGPPWYVESETGRVTSGGKLVTLYGDVRIKRAKSQYNHPVSIITQNITFRPDDNYVVTDSPVTYTSGVNQVYGIGMEANLNEGRIRLKRSAKGRYVPQPK